MCDDDGGKFCDGNGACVACLSATDCESGVCENGACIAATCRDGVKNGTETDVDCGGKDCPGCAQGKACGSGDDCASGNCPADDGVCCDTPCGSLCESCLAADTGGMDGTCAGVSDGTDPKNECPAAAGSCDGDSCSGTPGSCKAAVQGTVCRLAADICDAQEVCDGSSLACPDDAKKAMGEVCRAAAGGCDAEETCDGVADACPADAKQMQGFECRAAAGACDQAEACDGMADDCPADELIADGLPSNGGMCNPYLCDGANASCPMSCMMDTDCVSPNVCLNNTCMNPANCASILAGDPNAASGNYLIDPDGAGGNPPFSAYCDMTHDGGGWTNLDFTNDKVLLANNHYVFCKNGLTSSGNTINCENPKFDGDDSKPLYHYFCNGADASGKYIIDHIAPLTGHKDKSALGAADYEQKYTGGDTSSGDNEYCYVNGDVVKYNDPKCAVYNLGNGNCIPNYFKLTY